MSSGTDGSRSSTAHRRAIVAAILSGLFPGLGQLYNRDMLKAVLFLVGGLVTGFGPFSMVDSDIDLNDPAAGLRRVVLASLPFLAIALWSVIDAYRAASLGRE